MTVLLDPWQDWECPNACGVTERTRPMPPSSSRYHRCSRLHGLNAPLVRAGTDCKVYAQERMDYLGSEVQETGDDGKPYMAIYTEHASGRKDVIVHAGLAQASGKD